MKNIRKHMKYSVNRKAVIFYLFLNSLLLLSSCGKNDISQDRGLEGVIISEPLYENIGENDEAEKEFSAAESYAYEVEEMLFSFSVSEDETYHIPYVQISGCPNEKLQWEINHTLWKESCWILDCAEIGTTLYKIFDGENAMEIAGIYQYEQYLSILYEGIEESSLPGEIGYAIVIDTLNGNRLLLGDVIEDEDKFKNMLVHYFDGDRREIRLFIFEEDAEEILYYGRMTEAETVIDNITLHGEYPQDDNGKIDSVSFLFDSASFYMSEEGFVVLPGAYCYEPLVFEWEEMVGVVKDEF